MAIAKRHEAQKSNMVKASRLQILKAALKWFVTRLLLFAGLALLSFVGTIAFQALEVSNELEQCKATSAIYEPMEDATVSKLWGAGFSYFSNPNADGSSASQTLESMIQILHEFGNNVNSLKFDGRNCSAMGTSGGVEYKWNTFGALLFSTTIFTTVGYGNIAPQTTWGKITCFAYGMVGIPYMLWCLSVLGEVMGDIFQFVYVNICCLGFCARRARKKRRERLMAELKRRLRDTMIQKKLGVTGVPSSWKELYDARELEMNKLTGVENEMEMMVDDDLEEVDEADIPVPLTITLLVICGYIMLGAVLFAMWENWDWMAAAYYCFITISTIGFGDLVPGAAAKGVTSATDGVKMLVVAIYIVLGMAIISMAFNLIQENMAKKARAIEKKLAAAADRGQVRDNDSQSDDATPISARQIEPTVGYVIAPAKYPYPSDPMNDSWPGGKSKLPGIAEVPPNARRDMAEVEEETDIEETSFGPSSKAANLPAKPSPPAGERGRGGNGNGQKLHDAAGTAGVTAKEE